MPKTRATAAIRLGLLAVVLVCAVVFYEVRHARALGLPTLTPLAYTGSLYTFGAPDNSGHTMTLALFVAGANDGGLSSAACSVTAGVTCVNGQFTIPLPSSCTIVIQQNPNVQVEVVVDDVPLGLVNVSAVPYAIEAGTAVTAASATQTSFVDGGPGSVILNTGSSSISINGLYCGMSANATTGNVTSGSLVGYPAVKAICQATCGNAAAHMCSAEEIQRSFQTGVMTPYPSQDLWYETFVRWDTSTCVYDDCEGWQCGQSGRQPCSTECGAYIQNEDRLVNWGLCTASYHIACCL